MVLGSRFWVLGSPFLALALAVIAACATGPTAQSPKPAAAFDSARAYEHLRHVVSFGPRPSGSPAIERTRAYITEQLNAAGVTVTQQSFVAKTPVGDIPMVNLIATIPGARKERIAISGHYDTKAFREFRFVGANDGGSSTAFLIEMARVLTDRSNTFTIELIFFDGEEATLRDWGGTDHTYGSQRYVEAARTTGTLSGLKALVLVDMIAERSPRFLREAHSTPWLTEMIWATAKRLGHGSVFVDAGTPIEDDHVPFLKAGIPATDIIDLDYPAWHTAADTLDQTSARSLQIVGDVVLGSLGAIETRLSK
ncbi:MAG TPA: M28 family peptidase [Vicinamibacterales bacterium]|nr:M28 family peptidase [Vicinamibacterales bacterium]